MAETVATEIEGITTDQQWIVAIGKSDSSDHFVARVSTGAVTLAASSKRMTAAAYLTSRLESESLRFNSRQKHGISTFGNSLQCGDPQHPVAVLAYSQQQFAVRGSGSFARSVTKAAFAAAPSFLSFMIV
jgi:hypothetical protein